MRKKLMIAVLAASLAAGPAAFAQQAPDRGGIRSETQRRLAAGDPTREILNLIGLFGLMGLLGLRKGHSEDSYHPAPLD